MPNFIIQARNIIGINNILAIEPADTEEEPLRQAFVECGDVEDVRIVRDSRTGAGKGFGFILFKVT